jgi:TolB-like protein
MNTATIPIDCAEARAQVDRILRSRIFERAQRSQRFLRFVVDAALQEPPQAVKEYRVAIDVFDRNTAYDPSTDATVRVEASRLRSRLRDYYIEEGQNDSLVIEIPKGSYTAVLTRREVPAPAPVSTGPSYPGTTQTSGPETALPPILASLARRKSTTWKPFAIAAFIFSILLLIGGGFWVSRHRMRNPVAVNAPTSLAILPIANNAGDATLLYLSEGLTSSLIRQLSDVPALKLMARDSVFHLRSRGMDARSVGRALGVSNVMTGELRRSADHLVLSVEMSRVQDGSIIFNREYLVDGYDLRLPQAEIQRDILDGLNLEGSARDPNLHGALTSSAQAYQEFLQGDFTARGNAPEELHKAISHFEKAVALDPHFDLAWSALASAHVLLGLYFEPPRQHMPVGREDAEQALRLNPSLGEAHGSLGVIHLVYDWDVPAAEGDLALAGAQRAAISTLTCTAHLLELTGHPHVAEQMLGRMISYDPQSSSLIGELGCVDYYRGNYDAAIQRYREALQADPHSPVPYWGLGKSLNQQRNYAEALKVLSEFKETNGFEPPLLTGEIGYALGASGNKRQALAEIHLLIDKSSSSYVDPYFVSLIYLSLNDRNAAFLWLNRAFQVKSPFMISIMTEPKWEPLRNDPRFLDIVRRMLQQHN